MLTDRDGPRRRAAALRQQSTNLSCCLVRGRGCRCWCRDWHGPEPTRPSHTLVSTVPRRRDRGVRGIVRYWWAALPPVFHLVGTASGMDASPRRFVLPPVRSRLGSWPAYAGHSSSVCHGRPGHGGRGSMARRSRLRVLRTFAKHVECGRRASSGGDRSAGVVVPITEFDRLAPGSSGRPCARSRHLLGRGSAASALRRRRVRPLAASGACDGVRATASA
jgi:hypothetical protein